MSGIQANGNHSLLSGLGAVAQQFNTPLLAGVTFVLAATVLACLEHLVWKEFIFPHATLVRCVPVDAVITATRLEQIGTGPDSTVFPRITFQYKMDGENQTGTMIRHPKSVLSEGAAGNAGEIQFQGPQRQKWARDYLSKYRVGQQVTAWVTTSKPAEAMLVKQELNAFPFLAGVIPGLFIPFFWMFFAHLLLALTGRPAGRWIGCGWSALGLASLYPVFYQYQVLLDPNPSDIFVRFQDVGISLLLVVFFVSFLPAVFRSGMAIGLIPSLSLMIAVGVVRAVFHDATRLPAAREPEPQWIIVRSLEYGVYGGATLGLLIGFAAWRRFIWVWPNDDKQPAQNHVG